MKPTTALAILAITLALPGNRASAAAPEETPDTPQLNNAYRAGWLQFSISSGRVVLSGSRGINVSTSSGGTDRREQLTVRMGGGDPMVDYQFVSPEQDITLDVSSRNRVHLRRKPKGASKLPLIDFEQPSQGPITVRVGEKDAERTYQAPGLWHLVVTEPELARQRLVPLLKLLNRDWDLMKTAGEIQAALLVAANDRNLPDKSRWAQWVEQLGDPRYSKRESADRQLRETGRVVVTYLQRLDTGKLDAEQQYRVRRILASLSDGDGSDTPERIAAWLAGDASVWVALLQHDDEATRRLALRQLSALLQGPLDFDPTADAATRQKQVERLRTRLASK